jgi:hypothetical protein
MLLRSYEVRGGRGLKKGKRKRERKKILKGDRKKTS